MFVLKSVNQFDLQLMFDKHAICQSKGEEKVFSFAQNVLARNLINKKFLLMFDSCCLVCRNFSQIYYNDFRGATINEEGMI